MRGDFGYLLIGIGLALISVHTSAQVAVNPCPDGQFMDYTASPSVCRSLIRPEHGFRFDRLADEVSERSYRVSSCTGSGLRAAIAEAQQAGGGVVDLSACGLIQLDRTLNLPSHTILQGGGKGKTILQGAPGEPDHVVRIVRVENVVVRDLTVDGNQSARLGVSVVYAGNVLLERVELTGAVFNGVNFSYSRHITVRYSEAHGMTTFNGLSSKDCYPDSTAFTVASCVQRTMTAADNDLGFGDLFTSNYSVHSNILYDNADYCLAFHARDGEVAGNWCYESRRGIKFPDAQDVYVHHNRIERNREYAIHIYAPTQGIAPRNLYLFRNQVLNNGEFAARIVGAQVFLLHNHYAGNNRCEVSCWDPPGPGVDALRLASYRYPDSTRSRTQVQVCPYSEELQMSEEGHIYSNVIELAPPGLCLGLASWPIDLKAFDVEVQDRDMILRWTVASDSGAAGYAVELGADVLNFREVGYVPVEGQVGSIRSYEQHVSDLRPLEYRVRLRKVGETVSYTPEIRATVRRDTATATALELTTPEPGYLEIYPQPVEEHATLRFVGRQSGWVNVSLVDVLGRRVRMLFTGQVQIGQTQTLHVDRHDLPGGLYWVTIQGAGIAVRQSLIVIG